jgi:hypothetical protein
MRFLIRAGDRIMSRPARRILKIAEMARITNPSPPPTREYFRRDQADGISPPDLSKECSFAEHIVHARGKRTQYTSVSLDLTKIKDFGETDYKLNRQKAEDDGHTLVEHEALIEELRRISREDERAERIRAVQALRYATRRKEGLVQWSFDSSGVLRKDLIAWAQPRITPYFTRLR